MPNLENTAVKSSPLLITRGLVMFPGPIASIDVGRLFSLAAMNKALDLFDGDIVVVTQKDIAINEPTIDDIYRVGTLCHIESAKDINGTYRMRVTGLKRVKCTEISTSTYQDKPCFDCEYMDYPLENGDDYQSLENNYLNVLNLVINSQIPNLLPRPVIYRLQKGIGMEEASNQICFYLELPIEMKQALLEETSLNQRFVTISNELSKGQIEDEINATINNAIRTKSEKQQREYILREKLKAIEDELDKLDPSEDSDSVEAYLKKLDSNPYPENIKTKIKSEIKRLNQLPTSSAEYSMAKGYIDTMMSVPWYEESIDNNDIKHAENVLNEDHYGLEKVKERILEYLAVKNVTNSLKAPILCLYGPPGTGKTSLAKSVARALNRKFVKASLGGTSDEAEIRGHRRTYVASMPGKIIKGMQKAGVVNPVFLLDEIDKMTSNIHGDPASAMLEVLDPEQNSFFQDNYLEEPYDLSKVLFIATANYLDNIPAALRDRLELIELNTYTNEEKYHIAVEHLIKKECSQNGIDPSHIIFTDEALYYIMDYYTRESGVRELERKIGTIIRKALVDMLKNNSLDKIVTVDIPKVKEYLGTEIFDVSLKEKVNQVGVVTGLAYTQVGGDILPIEVNYFAGKGGLVLTGNLGNVMKESATIALDYVKANAARYNIDPKLFLENDIHIHVPEGAVPKDGPSAGIAMTVAIVSACSHKKVLSNVAMTGEVTLRGKALAIGGLKEKTLAAYRSGITKVLIPQENERNLADLAPVVLKNLKFVLISSVDDALKEALEND